MTEVAILTALAIAAVQAGGGHVLDTSHVIFPNGAITLVLILAESHLSIHTWPEENLIAIDLFSCGAIDGQRVIDELTAALRLAEGPRAPGRAGHSGPAAALSSRSQTVASQISATASASRSMFSPIT